jgi:transposase InsO family protein
LIAHINRLAERLRLERLRQHAAGRRGPGKQWPWRELDWQVRRGAVELGRLLSGEDWTQEEIGGRLGIAPRTWRDWQHRLSRSQRLDLPLGRQCCRAPLWLRQQVLGVLAEVGPGLSVPALRECFPLISRAELADLLLRFRRLWRRPERHRLAVLQWTEPGRVWAMDFTEAPAPVDGYWPYLLAIRDLASGQQLLWQPVREMTAAVVVQQLRGLFGVFGPPLVLKSDNGSAFCAELVQALLAEQRVIALFSPPGCPWYNGAIEAAIGAFKVRTELQAVLHGRPGLWTWDDLETARQEGNRVARPCGGTGPVREECWLARSRIEPAERERFLESVQRCREEVVAEGQAGDDSGAEESAAAKERRAIQRALVEHGYLLFSRRRIPPPIPVRKVASIP